MNGGKLFLVKIFILLAGGAYAQSLSHQVLVPLAGVATGTNVSYSQTVGETAVEIVGCHDYIFTQGFQQPGIKYSDLVQPQGTGVNVFPNPAVNHITFELFGQEARTFTIEILNITGTVVGSARKTFTGEYWFREDYNIENLIRGFYLVRILSDDRMVNRTFKIEKL